MNIDYSFIIPHHNSLELLNRCLDSIPQREDIEIIVVDDNSNVDNKPQISRPDMKIIYVDAESSKGAGRARNIGLEHAIGKWILFADADDKYERDFINVLDKYKDTNFDVVYYNAEMLDIRTKKIRTQPNILNLTINEYLKNANCIDKIKYCNTMPWNKMISKKLIDKYHIRCEEIQRGNDVFLSYQVGYYAQNVAIEPEYVYIYYYQDGSITNISNTLSSNLRTITILYKKNAFKRFIGHKEWTEIPFLKVIKLSIHDKMISLPFFYLFHLKDIKSGENYYTNELIIKKRLNG